MPPSADPAAIRAFNSRSRAEHWPFTCFSPDSLERDELRRVSALWRDLTGERRMPARAELTARAMKPWMPQMSLLERVETADGRRYRIRLHGSALARYGTGMFLEDVVRGGSVDGYVAVYDMVLDLLAPLRVVSRYQAPDISYLGGESFVAPLSRPDALPLILSVTYIKPRAEIAEG